MLRVSALAVRYGDVAALDGVDMTVGDGEVVAVVGPSGCGKSTLLRTIAGLEVPAAGTVEWDGTDLATVPPHRRGFGLMFQEYALFPHRDVASNVAFGPRMQRRSRTETAAVVTHALDVVGLGAHARRRVDQLSGGEQQRVALARVLAAAPRLVLLDEPLGSLDRALRDELLGELGRILADRTVVYVTHDQEEAFAVGDRLVVLRDGRVDRAGTPEDVWWNPGSEWTARFLGLTDVVDAEVHDGALRLPWGVAMPVPTGAGDDAVPHGPVRAVVYPGAAVLDPDGDVAGIVETRRFHGARTSVLVRPRRGPRLEITVTGRPEPGVGERVRLRFDPGRIALLDQRDSAGQPGGS